MVLQGSDEGLVPPFDAPAFGAGHTPDTPAADYVQHYDDCKAVSAYFTIDGDITPILPEGDAVPAVGTG